MNEHVHTVVLVTVTGTSSAMQWALQRGDGSFVGATATHAIRRWETLRDVEAWTRERLAPGDVVIWPSQILTRYETR